MAALLASATEPTRNCFSQFILEAVGGIIALRKLTFMVFPPNRPVIASYDGEGEL